MTSLLGIGSGTCFFYYYGIGFIKKVIGFLHSVIWCRYKLNAICFELLEHRICLMNLFYSEISSCILYNWKKRFSHCIFSQGNTSLMLHAHYIFPFLRIYSL